MGLLDFMTKKEFEFYEDLTEDEQVELEELMDNLNLEEWQKELVREGKYNPEDFEEEAEDEDDYYYDDEKDDYDEEDEEEEDDE